MERGESVCACGVIRGGEASEVRGSKEGKLQSCSGHCDEVDDQPTLGERRMGSHCPIAIVGGAWCVCWR
jgi:hypothetical protein